ncbi:granule-bound starch synthase 1, chloroplastic/amyloplastic-like [Camellia sinensis]|uniref:granule-bound starch synthase 1, chloroplastic/amyloplastic-like n=1 Tax=Camellia sinensis TaxID=4442 RepID=UPI0010362FB0|nr:granule-bound starch synthase 1, chloroplastic/amyloplastic-like [Camellia sinensis]
MLSEDQVQVFACCSYDKPAKGRKINWMKGGILESDRVVTVSPYYAQELVSGIDKGVELDNIIRKTGITGIVNGMDVQEWNPSIDKYIDVKYNATTVMAAKCLLKEALQAEVGLPVDANIPLIGFIGRLEEQKGSDILAAAIPKFIRENVQIVVLGTGKKYIEKQLEQLEIIYPDKARRVEKFNVPLAHMIIAGSDFMLLPSRFEPCGLIQLHAMQYGSATPLLLTVAIIELSDIAFTVDSIPAVFGVTRDPSVVFTSNFFAILIYVLMQAYKPVKTTNLMLRHDF